MWLRVNRCWIGKQIPAFSFTRFIKVKIQATEIHDGTADMLDVATIQKGKADDEEKVGEEEDIGSRMGRVQLNQTIKVLK